MEKKLTIRDSSKIFITENGCTFSIYSIFEDSLYVASVQFNLTTQYCEILNSFKEIPRKDLENCVYQKRIEELEKLKTVSNPDTFEILDNLLKDLHEKIHE